MLKTSLTVLVTAAVCFGIAAATGLASERPQRAHDQPEGRRHRSSRRRTTSTARCSRRRRSRAAARRSAGQVSVYYGPKQLNVVQFPKTGNKATVLFAIKR